MDGVESMVDAAGRKKQLVALTGATGFIGRHLLRLLPPRGYDIRVLLRRPGDGAALNASGAVVGDLARPVNMAAALEGADAVIHSAGVAHAMSGIPADDYRVLNTEATVALARAARRAGVRRFVFMSSIRAQSGPVNPQILTEHMTAAPTDDYGRSKLAAERGLADLDFDWVALRPVLVCGPGARGNLAALATLARSRLPLPLGALRARRSLVGVESLVAAVDLLLSAPTEAMRRPYIVADPQVLTVGEIVTAMRRGLGRRPGLWPVPPSALAAAMRLVGREEDYERLAGQLIANPAALMALGWRAEPAVAASLAAIMRVPEAG